MEAPGAGAAGLWAGGGADAARQEALHLLPAHNRERWVGGRERQAGFHLRSIGKFLHSQAAENKQKERVDTSVRCQFSGNTSGVCVPPCQRCCRSCASTLLLPLLLLQAMV